MVLMSQVLAALLAVEHFAIMYVEMFLWDKPFGLKAFGQTPEQARASKVLAANQGLYNGFLAAGLLLSLVYTNRAGQIFFSACVLAAGIYGGLTAKRSILFVQALPAALCLITLLLAK
ncbi:MAG: DUF1304 domain-containing protein [Alphaproteobacteria bacterium]|nr:DUF1304 domain-containing protein [Alphaproteobacteria bacterium]